MGAHQTDVFCQVKTTQDTLVQIERLCDGSDGSEVAVEILDVGDVTHSVDVIEAVGEQAEEREQHEDGHRHGQVCEAGGATQPLPLSSLHTSHLTRDCFKLCSGVRSKESGVRS